ncbi:MAG: DUF3306 domain-containing protein, partial [Pseudomonadota bacterium]|nr:DUF3306 domain-containing protein [Pseudomonadota bacterium]
MSEQEKFLKRWSRRKREAGEDSAPAVAEERIPSPRDAEIGEPLAPAAPSAAAAEPAFDPASLPPLESIVANSDIRAFLRPGVPAGLTRAALRRAWSADPAIRDFIGLSENSWDFTAPNGVPGFGPLDPAEIPRLLAEVFGPETREKVQSALEAVERVADNSTPAGDRADSAKKLEPAAAPAADLPVDSPLSAPAEASKSNLSPSKDDNVAVQNNSPGGDQRLAQSRR